MPTPPASRCPGARALNAVSRAVATVALGAALVLGGCTTSATPPASFTPGTESAPRELNLIASDYAFLPSPLVAIRGETLLIHVVNAGLEPHEAVIGDGAVQTAWEEAEAPTADHPPGPTPVVSIPPDLAGIRVFVPSGKRVDLRWVVPDDSDGQETPGSPWFVGCHIPGHFAKGMVVEVRFLPAPGSSPATATPDSESAAGSGERQSR